MTHVPPAAYRKRFCVKKGSGPVGPLFNGMLKKLDSDAELAIFALFDLFVDFVHLFVAHVLASLAPQTALGFACARTTVALVRG